MTTNSAYKTIQAKAVEHISAELENMEDAELLAVFQCANSYDGCFDWCDAFDIEEVVEMMDKYEIARSIIYGNVTNICEPVRFNGCGNLENVSVYQLYDEAHDNVSELAYWLLDDAASIDIDTYNYEGERIRKISERWQAADENTIDAVVAMMSKN